MYVFRPQGSCEKPSSWRPCWQSCWLQPHRAGGRGASLRFSPVSAPGACAALSVRSSFFFGAVSAHTHVHLFLGCWPVACICSILILETRQWTCRTPVLNLWSTLSSFLSVVDLGSRFCRYPVTALLLEHGMTWAPLFSCFFQSVSLLLQPTLSDYGNYEASVEVSGESFLPVFPKAFGRIGLVLPLNTWPPSETAFLSLWEDRHPQSL